MKKALVLKAALQITAAGFQRHKTHCFDSLEKTWECLEPSGEPLIFIKLFFPRSCLGVLGVVLGSLAKVLVWMCSAAPWSSVMLPGFSHVRQAA